MYSAGKPSSRPAVHTVFKRSLILKRFISKRTGLFRHLPVPPRGAPDLSPSSCWKFKPGRQEFTPARHRQDEKRVGFVIAFSSATQGELARRSRRSVVIAAGKLDAGGVEYLETRDGRLMFYDINANSNLRPSIAQAFGFDPFEPAVDFLVREMKRGVTAAPRRIHSLLSTPSRNST